jgi:hypothetical protein
MASRDVIRAWVVRWEWAGAHAAVAQPVAAVLRPQLSAEHVRRIVEALYAARQYSPDEMVEAIRRRGHQPYPARFSTVRVDPDGRGRSYTVRWEGEVFCGANPFLLARKARVWPAADGSGAVHWEDDPRPE